MSSERGGYFARVGMRQSDRELHANLDPIDTRDATRHDRKMSHPTIPVIVLFGMLAFVLAASADWLETRYVRAVRAWEDGDTSARERAARSSVSMWLVSVIALITVIEVSWYVLPFEALGLYVGTKLAMR